MAAEVGGDITYPRGFPDSDTERLIGRDAEAAAIDERIDCAVAGDGSVVLVTGAAGLGKSALLAHAARSAAARNLAVRWGVSTTLGLPFEALFEAFPECRRATERKSPDSAFSAMQSFEDALEDAAAAGPLLVVLDDLHRSGPTTLTALRVVMRRSLALPAAVVVAFRTPLPRNLAEAVDDVRRGGATSIHLGALSDEDLVRLAHDRFAAVPGPRLVRRLAGAGGNPLFAAELLAAAERDNGLVREGGIVDLSNESLPSSFREAVLERTELLSERAAALLRQAAVLGTTFSASELVAITGRPMLAMIGEIDELQGLGLLVERDERVAFRHELIRVALYESYPADVRRRLHVEIASALRAAGAPAIVVAAHARSGARTGDVDALRALREAARDVGPFAPQAAVDLLTDALELSTDPAERVAIDLDLTLALARAGSLNAAEKRARAQTGERSAGDGSRNALAYALMWQGRPRSALAMLGPRADREDATPELLAHAAIAAVLCGEIVPAKRYADRVIDGQRDVATSGYVAALCAQAWSATFSGSLDEGCRLALSAVSTADLDPDGAYMHPRYFCGLSLLLADRLDEAERTIQQGREAAERAGAAWTFPLWHSFLANVHWLRAAYDDALAEDEAGRTIAADLGMRLTVMSASASRVARIALARGDIDIAAATLGEAEAWLRDEGVQTGSALVTSARALLLEAQGDVTRAATLAREAWDANVAAGLSHEVRVLAPDLVRLSLAAGKRAEAEHLLTEIDVNADRLDVASAQGAALRCHGLVARDPDVFVAAVQAYDRSPRRMEFALCAEDAAETLATSGRTREAREYTQRAAKVYSDAGAVAYLSRLRQRMKLVGISMDKVVVAPRPVSGWESLTKAERCVAELVARGATNREVAEQLYISRHTVDSHLRHIFAKLGISSRVKLAAIAPRGGR